MISERDKGNSNLCEVGMISQSLDEFNLRDESVAISVDFTKQKFADLKWIHFWWRNLGWRKVSILRGFPGIWDWGR
jgi:hypothetical protein